MVIDLSPGARAILEGMRDLFADPKRHTTGTAARNTARHPVHSDSKSAVCWCLIGGQTKIEHDLQSNWRDGLAVSSALDESIRVLAVCAEGEPIPNQVSVNEMGRVIIGASGEELTGLPAVQRLIQFTLDRAA